MEIDLSGNDSICWIRASPRLKDASIPAEEYHQLYRSLMVTVRKMYHICKLVHADLSEYNILYHQDSSSSTKSPTRETQIYNHLDAGDNLASTQRSKGTLYIIDVSQSVEHDHPSAYDFLRSDLKNVKRFFEGRGVRCLSLRRAFEFITQGVLHQHSEAVSAGEGDLLDAWIEEEGTRGDTAELDDNGETELEKYIAATKASEDSVFLNSFIPRNFNEVTNPEKILDAHSQREKETLIKAKMPKESSRVRFDNVPKQEQETDEESEGEDEDAVEDEAGTEEEQTGDAKNVFQERKPRGHRHEDRETKKVCVILIIHMVISNVLILVLISSNRSVRRL